MKVNMEGLYETLQVEKTLLEFETAFVFCYKHKKKKKNRAVNLTC